MAAVQGHTDLKCPITPKVHLMLKHVEGQMEDLSGGLGEKMEDWVERLHQDGIRERLQFRTVKNPVIRAKAREKVHMCNSHAEVLAFAIATNEGNKRNLSESKDDTILATQKQQRKVGRKKALIYFEQVKNKKLTWSSKLFDDATGEKIDPHSPTKDEGELPAKGGATSPCCTPADCGVIFSSKLFDDATEEKFDPQSPTKDEGKLPAK